MSFKTKTILDGQSELLPPGVKEEIQKIWKLWDNLGNDWCYVPWEYIEDDKKEFPLLTQYIKDSGEDEENILIHYWW